MPRLLTPKGLWVVAAAVAVVGAILWLLPEIDRAFVEAATRRVGPLAIILLVALGIVVSPIPSGAVAMVAGAVYGWVAGGVLTIAGAVLGATVAFALSRRFGRGHLAASDHGIARALTRERSQNGLTLVVFASRLVPFISFDAVSYVAGLTPIRAWRFVAATALGTTPVCFAFAAAGGEAVDGPGGAVGAVALCGVTLLLPLVIWVWRLAGLEWRFGGAGRHPI